MSRFNDLWLVEVSPVPVSETLVLAGLLSATLFDDFGVGLGMVVPISEDLVLTELLSVTLFDD